MKELPPMHTLLKKLLAQKKWLKSYKLSGDASGAKRFQAVFTTEGEVVMLTLGNILSSLHSIGCSEHEVMALMRLALEERLETIRRVSSN